MRISAPVELAQARRDCALHHWVVECSGRGIEEEVYTCEHCGASWRRTVSFNGHGGQAELPAIEWPTWEEIIAEP